MTDTTSAAPSEREKFEAWLQPYWPREKYRDDEGDELYCDSWVQGAWMGWQGRAAPPPAVVEPLTVQQIWASDEIMSANAMPMDDLLRIVRAVEAAHGIGVKKGESNGLPT